MTTLTTNVFGIEIGNILVETCQSVSGLSVGQDVIEVKQMTRSGELIVRKQPGPSQAGELTISRGMDKSKAFTDWIKTTRQNTGQQNIAIVSMDAQMNVVRRFFLIDAWASSWEGPSLDGDSTGPEQVTITYVQVHSE